MRGRLAEHKTTGNENSQETSVMTQREMMRHGVGTVARDMEKEVGVHMSLRWKINGIRRWMWVMRERRI